MMIKKRVGDSFDIDFEARDFATKTPIVLTDYTIDAFLSDGYSGVKMVPLSVTKLIGVANTGKFIVSVSSAQSNIFPSTYEILVHYTDPSGKRESLEPQFVRLEGV